MIQSLHPSAAFCHKRAVDIVEGTSDEVTFELERGLAGSETDEGNNFGNDLGGTVITIEFSHETSSEGREISICVAGGRTF